VEEILLFLYKKNYKDNDKEMARIRIMYFINKCCENEDKFRECMLALDRYEMEKKGQSRC
jgi:hypothetical protein